MIRLEKRFKADLLQRNYQDFADQFGLSKKQTKDAFDLLEELGIIYREFRILEIRGRAMNNVLYIGPDVDKLRECSMPALFASMSRFLYISVEDLILISMVIPIIL